MSKYFILNAEGFGLSKEHNQLVLDGYNSGFLSSASICPSGNAFSAAVNDILPECSDLGLGIQFNLSFGKSITKCKYLTDNRGFFNKGCLYYMFYSSVPEILGEIEREFRAQIELVTQYKTLDHISSVSNIHAIPKIFDIVSKLAKEYNIPFVCSHNEILHIIPDSKKNITFRHLLNIINVLVLGFLTMINRKTIEKYGLKTNTNYIGLEYASMMNDKSVKYGLKSINNKDNENSIIHCKIETLKELDIAADRTLQDTIERFGYEITNYGKV